MYRLRVFEAIPAFRRASSSARLLFGMATANGSSKKSGQVFPVSYQGQKGSFVHQMFLNDHPAIAGGRELWRFPKKLAQPKLAVEMTRWSAP